MSSSENTAVSEVYGFGAFRLDCDARQLWKGGAPVTLTPKAFETLLFLVRNAGKAVKRQDLIEAVWPDAVVTEGSLDWAISTLRRSLGEEDGAIHIETVRGYGYRFVDGVSPAGTPPHAPVDTNGPAPALSAPAPTSVSNSKRLGVILAVVA